MNLLHFLARLFIFDLWSHRHDPLAGYVELDRPTLRAIVTPPPPTERAVEYTVHRRGHNTFSRN